MSKWVLYILKCNDDTFYTGITNNLEKRISDHESGIGAKYTRGRGPFEIAYTEKHANRNDASKREYEIKKLNRSDKETLIKQGH
ncbi:GIY-YIG nuclease family protein [Pseudemcibacter aquimaris]|uniref:GIY-YIG nuclease family protein n=1 Tax=Pseudemcibacter aquimaris TaxID=2857064 RepID=UPI0020137A74|nr:GIY-YIG nuclease family protein [Pseudemcibacter aquimaris]MCC3860306.1 GIY-YIG nuclease family protein [Pseudemcibacter aquimaris]WDU57630.1 GIY-YIG nuclease family protein [Pseudemcibacter aquimaris]